MKPKPQFVFAAGAKTLLWQRSTMRYADMIKAHVVASLLFYPKGGKGERGTGGITRIDTMRKRQAQSREWKFACFREWQWQGRRRQPAKGQRHAGNSSSSVSTRLRVRVGVGALHCTPVRLWYSTTLRTAAANAKFFSKFHYAKRRFSIISKYRHMYGVLNVDEIKN
jgi:hypothetical protein